MVKNSSDKAITLIVNEREITLEPCQATTVIPITYGVIQKIAKLQDEIINGKTIEELEETATGKELIKELSSLGEAIFEHGGHYSNISANFSNLSSQASANAPAVSNVGGGQAITLDTLAVAINEIYPTKQCPNSSNYNNNRW